jgi:tetratricopeptide (TPR) repeat protein
MSQITLPSDQKIQSNNLFQKIAKLISAGGHDQVISELNNLDKSILFAHSGLLNAFGVSLRSVGRPEAAIQMYRLALNLDDSHGGTWSNLGNALKDANYPNTSIAAHSYALNLSSQKDSRLWHNYGIALAIAGENEKAISAFESAIKINPEHKGLHWDLARSQLAIKDYQNGFENYKYRWSIEDAPPKRVFGIDWVGEPLVKQKLFVYVEQGFGDYIQCARYLPWLKELAPNLVVEVKEELKILMENSYPSITFISFKDEKIDYKEGPILSLLDAPRFFTGREIPGLKKYLIPNKIKESHDFILQEKLSGAKRLNVGVIWSGSVTFKRNKYRSAPVEWFANNLSFPGVKLYSLQMGPKSEDLNKLALLNISKDLIPLITDFNDTAAILQKLDLVVMTCSSVAHLCGALGVPCWVLLDKAPHWLWGQDGSSSDWYESVRLFRQNTPGDWRSVFDDVGSELLQMSAKRKND